MSVQEGDMLQGSMEKQPAGDPRFGDPIADPEGYAERKLAFYKDQPGYIEDDGEGRTWWNIKTEIPLPHPTSPYDDSGRPVADMQAGILFGHWRLTKIEPIRADSEEDRRALLDYIAQHIQIGAVLQLSAGRTGYQIPSIGLIADWWTDEDLNMFYMRPECKTCEGFQAPVSMIIEQFPNQGQLLLLLEPHQWERGSDHAIRLTFVNEF